MCLDQTHLWFSRGIEGDNMMTALRLADSSATQVVEESTSTFSVKTRELSTVMFRAKSKQDMLYWKSAIEERMHRVSENNLIAMADEHVDNYERSRVTDNFLSLSQLSGFKGVLCNRLDKRLVGTMLTILWITGTSVRNFGFI